MLKIRGISNAENLLTGVNRFGHCLTRELTDFLPWQWARAARLTGQKVRSNDWFAPQSGAGLSGGLTQSGNSSVRTAKRCERADHRWL